MLERWRNLAPGERFRLQMFVIFLLVGFYMLLVYPISRNKMLESEKMLHRRKDRIEKRATTGDLTKIGPSPQIIGKKIEEVDKALAEVAASFDELDTGFANVDSGDVRQELLLEISKLAERSGVELVSVGSKGASAKGDMPAVVIDPQLGRPMLKITANAPFASLMRFLQGLRELSFYASVMNLKVYARPTKEAGAPKPPPAAGPLFVSLELSI